ncbi:MAG: hypothetical protein ACPGHD_04100 [Flavobacteriaceae bacterium]
MNPFLRNGLAVLLGIFIGAIINFAVIFLSSYIVTPPTGVDVTNVDSVKANIGLYKPIHFLFPFLAHALGTLAGAVMAIKISNSKKTKVGFIVALVFLYGGVSMVTQVPSPLWFSIFDLAVAYIPMAWIATKLMR